MLSTCNNHNRKNPVPFVPDEIFSYSSNVANAPLASSPLENYPWPRSRGS